MKFKSRAAQVAPATSLPLSILSFSAGGQFTDNIFDTAPLPRPIRALNWTPETHVHGGILITGALRDANQFVGTQVMTVRDEVRQQTHIAAIETDGLYHYVYAGGSIKNRRLVASGDIARAHLTLRKYDGQPLVSYVLRKTDATSLYIEDKEIINCRDTLDFPFFVILQPPIGYPAVAEPRAALLFYKDRTNNRLFARQVDPVTLLASTETNLGFVDALGGVDAAMTDAKCVARAQVMADGKLCSHLVVSTDLGASFSQPVLLDLSTVPHDTELPANAPATVDNTFHFHIPVAVKGEAGTTLLDVLPDDDLAVAAIAGPTAGSYSLAAFPSMSGMVAGFREGFGDGTLDGSGMIATLAISGQLLVSNSQSGGYSYPAEATLNHEMQTVFGFRATECYTRGGAANEVSMDYAFVESDSNNRPVSAELWIDTWDMPLPEPRVTHTFANGVLTLQIQRSGWFFHGQTAFQLEPANTFITKVTMNGFREIALEFDDPTQMPGTTVSFETKNVFYHYGAKVKIV